MSSVSCGFFLHGGRRDRQLQYRQLLSLRLTNAESLRSRKLLRHTSFTAALPAGKLLQQQRPHRCISVQHVPQWHLRHGARHREPGARLQHMSGGQLLHGRRGQPLFTGLLLSSSFRLRHTLPDGLLLSQHFLSRSLPTRQLVLCCRCDELFLVHWLLRWSLRGCQWSQQQRHRLSICLCCWQLWYCHRTDVFSCCLRALLSR